MEGSTSLVCSADVAAFVDALETINYNEAECYDSADNVVICIPSPPPQGDTGEEMSVTDIEDACTDNSGGTFFNPDTRKLKAIMQQLVATKKAAIVKKSLVNTKGAKSTKQFKSDVWNWFGDVRLFVSEGDAARLKIPFYVRPSGTGEEGREMICKVFVGCFRCSALFMYDAQKHSTSTLRYHVRACNRPKECIFVSEDKMDEDPQEAHLEGAAERALTGAPPAKRFRTDPRKQKEVIEQLFQRQRAVVTKKSFMNMKGNRRFKSDVWNWFGDIKLLISRSEAKKLKIPYYIRRCGDEQMVLSKVFVGCFKCLALFIHDSQKSTSTLRYHIRTCSRPKERKKRTTPNIIFIPNKNSGRTMKEPRAMEEGDAIPAHEKLLNFSLSTEGSLEVLKDPEFHKVLQMCITVGAIYGDVNIDSLLCATPTLTSFILNDLYVTSINEFYTEFQHSYGATYKPCVWIDEQMKSPFVSVYCSYATQEGDLKSVILHTDDFDYESKTVENLRDWFGQFLSDQPVIPFKRLIAIDNESNLVQAFQDEAIVKCSVQHLTNILQLVSSKGAANANSELPDFTNLLSNCVDLVEHFDQVSEEVQLPEELTKCLDDKWTSILALFRSIDSNYDNILNALNATNTTHLLSVEKNTISTMVEFFKVFEDAIVQLSSSAEPTLNLVIPWMTMLQRHCNVEHHNSAALKQFKSNVGLEISGATKSITAYHRMATFLDPRFKKLTFGTVADHLEANVKMKCLVRECMESPNMEDMIDSRKRHEDSFSDFYSASALEAGKCEKAALEEVDKYLAEPYHGMVDELDHLLQQGDPSELRVLKYWSQHSEVYPNLSRIALWLLSCPASCAQENESFWSNSWLVHCPRFPIPPDNVNKVLFVKTFRGL